jgi:hypothetical protein
MRVPAIRASSISAQMAESRKQVPGHDDVPSVIVNGF